MSQPSEKTPTELMSSLSSVQTDALTRAIERCYLVDFTKTMPTMEDRLAIMYLQTHFPYVDEDSGLHYSIYTATRQIEYETKIKFIRRFLMKYKISNFVDNLAKFTQYDNYDSVHYEWLKLESLLKIICLILDQSMPDPDECHSVKEILQSYIDLWWHLDQNVIPQSQ